MSVLEHPEGAHRNATKNKHGLSSICKPIITDTLRPTHFEPILHAHELIAYEFRLYYHPNMTARERSTGEKRQSLTVNTNLLELQYLSCTTRTCRSHVQLILHAHEFIAYEFRIYNEHIMTVLERPVHVQSHTATLSMTLLEIKAFPTQHEPDVYTFSVSA